MARPTDPEALAFSTLGLAGGSYECSCNHDQGYTDKCGVEVDPGYQRASVEQTKF